MKFFLNIIFMSIIVFPYHDTTAGEHNKQYEWSTSIGTNGLLLRNSLNDKHKLFYGVGYSVNKANFPRNKTTHQAMSLKIGHRYYITQASIKNFLDSSLSYTYFTGGENSDDPRDYDLNFLYGLEKFISNEFSLEGSVGLGIQYSEYSSGSAIGLSTPIAKIAINYYF